VRRCVDEVAEAEEGGGEADRRTVKRSYEDLRVAVEGLCNVEVLRDEAA
jgi:hypothetical protein